MCSSDENWFPVVVEHCSKTSSRVKVGVDTIVTVNTTATEGVPCTSRQFDTVRQVAGSMAKGTPRRVCVGRIDTKYEGSPCFQAEGIWYQLLPSQPEPWEEITFRELGTGERRADGTLARDNDRPPTIVANYTREGWYMEKVTNPVVIITALVVLNTGRKKIFPPEN